MVFFNGFRSVDVSKEKCVQSSTIYAAFRVLACCLNTGIYKEFLNLDTLQSISVAVQVASPENTPQFRFVYSYYIKKVEDKNSMLDFPPSL